MRALLVTILCIISSSTDSPISAIPESSPSSRRTELASELEREFACLVGVKWPSFPTLCKLSRLPKGELVWEEPVLLSCNKTSNVYLLGQARLVSTETFDIRDSGIAQWKERLAQDWKILGSNPSHADRPLWEWTHHIFPSFYWSPTVRMSSSRNSIS